MTVIHNPVVPGFHPDPSVCRVGKDYYLVTSSFEYFPGVPIFHSTDLVNWRKIGHCLTRKSQLNLENCPPSAGIFAPTIRYHAGTFYMITTNVSGGGNFYVTAQDPAGPWSEPIGVDAQVFDPSLFFDDDGKVYYTRRGEKGIVQAEIDLSSGKLKLPLVQLVDKFICTDIEGPHLYKFFGDYYLMAAEGGTRFGHCEVIGRSKSPWGPFEACPHNPILTHRDQAHPFIRDTGHVELVEDQTGNWWAFCLGTRHLRYDSAAIMGRETFLAPVRWQNGWPLIGQNHMVSPSFETDLLPPQTAQPVWRDDFNSAALDFHWNFLRNPNIEDWSLTERQGFLRLRGSALNLNDWASPAFVGLRQEEFFIQASCELHFSPQAAHEEAGLTVLMSSHYHYDLAVTLRNGKRCLILKKWVGDMVQEVCSAPIQDGPLTLSAACDGWEYHFSFRDASGEQVTLGSGLAKLISSEIAACSQGATNFTGIYLGMYATGNGKPCRQPADFDGFEVRKTLS